jgi:16S rRNA (uracil1498-N3)-methyltransferase
MAAGRSQAPGIRRHGGKARWVLEAATLVHIVADRGKAKAGQSNRADYSATAMPAYDFRSPRLYVEAPLAAGAAVALAHAQAHYLTAVLRLRAGDRVLVFNGGDGEWAATLTLQKRAASLAVTARTRAQTPVPDLQYLFAPLKSARLDYLVQKAVEMGAGRLQPVLTRHGQVARVNLARMTANAIEAAEQCGILSVPQIGEPAALQRFLADRAPSCWLVFCDEAADISDPVAALKTLPAAAPLAVLVGPEGGFADDERAALLELPNVVRLCLGPRILRADTAAVAALALVQAVAGDWRSEDRGRTTDDRRQTTDKA